MAQASNKILVADGDEQFLAQMTEAFKAEGLVALTTINGLRANKLVDEEIFAGIVTSIKLVSMNGLQIAESAKTSKQNSQVPVFILTTEAEAKPNREMESRLAKLPRCQLKAKTLGPTDLAKQLAVLVHERAAKLAAAQAKLNAQTASSAPAAGVYDVRIMNAFIDSLQEVFEFYLGVKGELDKPSVKPSSQTTGYLSSTIGFSGEAAKGSMALTFDKPLLLRFKEKMLPDPAIEATESTLADLAGEMANQVCGSVKRKLAGMGLKVNIGLPKVVIGKDHKLIHVAKNPVITISGKVEGHACGIEFCMTKNVDQVLEEAPAEEKDKEMGGGDVLLF